MATIAFVAFERPAQGRGRAIGASQQVHGHHDRFRSPLEHAASQLIGKARMAEALGEGGEVLLPTKQISQIVDAQTGIIFECS